MPQIQPESDRVYAERFLSPEEQGAIDALYKAAESKTTSAQVVLPAYVVHEALKAISTLRLKANKGDDTRLAQIAALEVQLDNLRNQRVGAQPTGVVVHECSAYCSACAAHRLKLIWTEMKQAFNLAQQQTVSEITKIHAPLLEAAPDKED